MAGQISLFELVSDEEKENFDIKMPDIGEYPKEMMLAFEKEVLGIYVSGHPLEEYEAIWRKNISNITSDFYLDTETSQMNVRDGENVIIGGIIIEKKIKYTKNDQVMAFITIEDLAGSVECIIFPKVYQKSSECLNEDNKVFVKGRVSAEEEKDGKLICESVQLFDEVKKELWIKFPNKDEFDRNETELLSILSESDGRDGVVLYIDNPRMIKRLSPNKNVHADQMLISQLAKKYGEQNVKLV